MTTFSLDDYVPPPTTEPFKTSLHSPLEIAKFLQDYAYLCSIEGGQNTFHKVVDAMMCELNKRLPLGFDVDIDHNQQLHETKGYIVVNIYKMTHSLREPVIVLRPHVHRFYR